MIRNYPENTLRQDKVGVICHDQEPLQFELYNFENLIDAIKSKNTFELPTEMLDDPEFQQQITNLHLRSLLDEPMNKYDHTVLVHSELNSEQVQRYSDHGFVPVYWWSHAAIAQDWFRYAKHDQQLNFDHFTKDFLVYCRAWTGSRQYRLDFLKDIVRHHLVPNCFVTFCATDNEVYYGDIRPDCNDFENLFSNNTATSSASADYNAQDYQNCAIELVLETLFDSNRIHLTEKICRPLACGKPFLLAGGSGSLQLLKHYGFKTFEPWIDESYDLESDHNSRRKKIIQEMQRLSKLADKQRVWAELHSIAKFNQQRFFSQQFTDMIFSEFVDNFDQAWHVLEQNQSFSKLKQFVEFARHKSYGKLFWDKGMLFEPAVLSMTPSHSSGKS